MNVLSARVAVRERGLLDVLDLTVRFTSSHAKEYAWVGLWVLLPAALASVAVGHVSGWALGWPFAVALASLASAPFTALASRLVFEDEVRVGGVLAAALRALPRLFVARVAQGMLLGLGVLLFVIGVVWVASSFMFLGEVVVLERASVRTALGRAPRIVATASGDAISAALLLPVLHFAAVALGDGGGRTLLNLGLQVRPPASLWTEGGGALAMLGFWLFVPFGATARFFLYLNYRTRSEGWDVQTRFAALVARAAVVVVVLAGLGVLAPASAEAMSVHRADDDVKTALATGTYGFCTSPPPARLLRAEALAVCPLAAEVPGCEKLAKVCDEALEKKEPPKPPEVPWLQWLAGALGMLAPIFMWVVVVAIVLAIAYPVLMAILRARREGEVVDAPPLLDAEARVVREEILPEVTDAELLLRKGEEAARAGDAERALALYLAASLRALDARGAVRITKDRTNGEYVRGCADAAARGPLRDIVREVDRVQFGREAPTAEGVARAATRASSLVRGVAYLAVTLVLVLGLGACQSGPLRAPRSDPAGDELVMDLLARQGLVARRLGGSLLSLPMPTEGTPSYAVVMSAGGTMLDDDASEHLVRWVKSGGTLVLLGRPSAWPEALRVKSSPSSGRDVVVDDPAIDAPEEETDDEATDDDDPAAGGAAPGDAPPARAPPLAARLAEGAALEAPGDARPVARAKEHEPETYAFVRTLDKGRLVGVASRDLFTNLGVARPGNAAALMALVGWIGAPELRFAAPEDGISPPSNPIAALHRAGLALPLWHAVAACAVLFLAAGSRMRRPLPPPPAERRAYAEHVEATGAFYARARLARHALGAYARWADERVRARMPRGSTDVAAFLAARSGRPVERVAEIWSRAMAARAGDDPRGTVHDLVVLKELSATLAAASL